MRTWARAGKLWTWSAAAMCAGAIGAAAAMSAEPVGGEPALASVTRTSSGISRTDGQVVGGGPDYSVRFTERGFVFLPALGARDAGDASLRFELESIARGEAALVPTPSPLEVGADGRTALRSLGDGASERFEARADGLEWSYELARLPAGAGDLVVRGRIQTELAPPAPGAHADELSFERGASAGVRIGAVTGIDADGRRAAGWLRLDGQHLELVLPADFVDRAALPLELDPLVGATINVATGGTDDAGASVAYDETNDVYLVAWHRDFGLSGSEIRAQRLSALGAPLGGMLTLYTDTATDHDVTVANCNLSNRFLVAWGRFVPPPAFPPLATYQILACAVSASSGAFTAATTFDTVTSANDWVEQPSAASEATTVDDELLLVYEDTGAIVGLRIELPAAGSPAIAGVFSVSQGSTVDDAPRISKSGGSVGHYLVVWSRNDPLDGFDVYGRMFDRDGVALTGEVGLFAMPDLAEKAPACDGDGAAFLVAYQQSESGTVAPHDVRCGLYLHAGAFLLPGPTALVAGMVGKDEIEPDVSYTGEEFLVGWSRQVSGTNYDAYVAGLDPYTCATCETLEALDTSAATKDGGVAIGAQYAGSLSKDSALLAWTSDSVGFGDVKAHLFRSVTGLYTDLAGGCGLAGTALASCAKVGNASFRHRVKNLPPLVPGMLAMGFTEAPVPCGSCVIAASPTGMQFFTGALGSFNSSASVLTAIPNDPGLVGAKVIDQWFLFTGAPSCPNFGVDLSNGLRIEIQ